MDCSQRGSSVHGILPARMQGWVAISFCRGASRPRDWSWVSSISCTAGRFVTSWAPGEAPDTGRDSQVALEVRNLPANPGRHEIRGFDPWVGKIAWKRARQPTPGFLTSEPRDRGGGRATVHRVTKSQTWLKRLSMHAQKHRYRNNSFYCSLLYCTLNIMH